MMMIYQVGPDVPYDLDENDERFEWVVHWYADGGYDGHGDAVALCKEDGLLYVKDLGHCSCYGPMDGGMESGDKYKIEEYLKVSDSALVDEPKDELKAKVAELCRYVVRPGGPIFEQFDFLGGL